MPVRSRAVEVNEALDRLTALIPYGELMAETNPAGFLDAVAALIVQLVEDQDTLWLEQLTLADEMFAAAVGLLSHNGPADECAIERYEYDLSAVVSAYGQSRYGTGIEEPEDGDDE